MRKKLALIFCLLAAVMMLSGCALIKKDTAITVLTVNGKTHTLGEFTGMLDANKDALLQLYNQQSGKDPVYDTGDADFLAFARGTVKDFYVDQDIMETKIAEYDAALTDEETTAYNEYQQYYNTVLGYFGNSFSGMSESEMDAQVRGFVESIYGVTEPISQREKLARAVAVKDGIEATDAEIEEEYNTHTEADKATYGEDAPAWATAKNNGTTLYYAPAGVRMVHQILVRFDEAETEQLTSLNEQIEALEQKLADMVGTAEATAEATTEAAAVTVESTLTAEADEEAAEAVEATEEAAATAESTVEANTPEEIRTEIARLEGEREALWTALREKADAVVEKARAGEDWAALTEEYNGDPGMAAGSETAVSGYAVCADYTDFKPEFVDGAMSLAAPGDVSDPIRSDSYNAFFIIRYTGDVTEGPVPLDDVRDVLKEHVFSEKADAHFTEVSEKWLQEAEIVFDEEMLKR